jgi:uncharacterized protein YjbI with pentapeptide repeats
MKKKLRNRVILGVGLVTAIAIIAVGYLPKANSFSGFKGKTLWDWLSLAGIPLSLAGLGFWLQLQQQKQNDLQKQRELEQTKALATIEQDIAEQSRQEEALQNYYDKVSSLLVEKNLLAITDKKDDATPEEKQLLDVSVDVIRARTLTTLRRLDKTRKTSLIQFLLESEVISKLNLSLAKADLTSAYLGGADLGGAFLIGANLVGAFLIGANLVGAFLNGANLSGADLRSAKLYGANLNSTHLTFAELRGAHLSRADLSGADIMDANFIGADLFEANLGAADLSRADLRGAYLGGADLTGANFNGADFNCANLNGANFNCAILTDADLSDAILGGADLSHAKGLTKEQLENAYLCKTTLPKEIGVDPDRDCDKPYDEWWSEKMKARIKKMEAKRLQN